MPKKVNADALDRGAIRPAVNSNFNRIRLSRKNYKAALISRRIVMYATYENKSNPHRAVHKKG
jgi:hypothetical protein